MLFITVSVTQNRESDRGYKSLHRLVINKVNKTFNNQRFMKDKKLVLRITLLTVNKGHNTSEI